MKKLFIIDFIGRFIILLSLTLIVITAIVCLATGFRVFDEEYLAQMSLFEVALVILFYGLGIGLSMTVGVKEMFDMEREYDTINKSLNSTDLNTSTSNDDLINIP